MYKDLIERMSQAASTTFDAIYATFGFDYGHEFEIALCKILRLVLPKKYSICRGHIVTSTGESAGDDIIIYDAYAFPKLRIIEDDLSIKQYIPIEAVYAYIEAKHTLLLEGSQKETTFSKACEQLNKIKSLPRLQRSFGEMDGYNLKAKISGRQNWPDYWNPLFTCIISRNIKKSSKSTEEITLSELNEFLNKIPGSQQNIDLIMGGQRFLGLPIIDNAIYSPFFIEGQSKRALFENKNSIGIGLSNLIWALESIKLGSINYPHLIAEALHLPLSKASV